MVIVSASAKTDADKAHQAIYKFDGARRYIPHLVDVIQKRPEFKVNTA